MNFMRLRMMVKFCIIKIYDILLSHSIKKRGQFEALNEVDDN